MNPFVFDRLPAWGMALSLGVHLAAGIAIGLLYFRSVWWHARLFAIPGRLAARLAPIAGRFLLLGTALLLASLQGALPLLTMTLGILGGRFVMMRRIGQASDA